MVSEFLSRLIMDFLKFLSGLFLGFKAFKSNDSGYQSY